MPNNSRLPWRQPPALPWSRYPLLPPALAVVMGISMAKYLGYPESPWALPGLLGILIVGCLVSSKSVSIRQRRHWLSLPILVTFALLGFWWASSLEPLHQTDHFSRYLREDGLYQAQIESLRPGENRLRAEVHIEGLVLNDRLQRSSGRALIYFLPSTATASLKMGDRILVKANLRPMVPPLNPGSFDFRAYWANQYIGHQAFLRSDADWRLLDQSVRSWRERATQLREDWIDHFRPHLAPDELAVAAALVLGKRDLISEELRSAYADTGAVHVLAVSGLHVGILASILLWLFRFLLPGQNHVLRWLRLLATITGIWAFALLTGFSPSVQRAALMFSVLLLGVERQRRSPLFNSLAVAALVILLYDPRQLFAIGFQLSFAAVAGIGLFQQTIARWWKPQSKILQPVWSVMSVSLAAQIGTLPLVMYYFQQFPLYFLLSGSLVIITAYGGLIAGLFHGLLSWLLPGLSGVSGALLNVDLSIQNAVVKLCRQLPGAAQQLDPISLWQVALLYAFILLIAAWRRWRRFGVAVAALLILLILGVFRLTQVEANHTAEGVVAFHQYGQSLLEVRRGRSGVSLQSEELPDSKRSFISDGYRKQARYTVDTNLNYSLAELQSDSLHLLSGRFQARAPLMQIHGRNWLLLSGTPIDQPSRSGERTSAFAGGFDPRKSTFKNKLNELSASDFAIDRVWIREDAQPNQLPDDWPWPDAVFIVDGSNRPWQVDTWKAWAEEHNIYLHMTS
ncbi:MAG: ComEC/Rec2 family competence protein, partial [Bacteroidota bacterium]